MPDLIYNLAKKFLISVEELSFGSVFQNVEYFLSQEETYRAALLELSLFSQRDS